MLSCVATAHKKCLKQWHPFSRGVSCITLTLIYFLILSLLICRFKFAYFTLIVTSSAIVKFFEIFGPIFEQNADINFEPIFEKSANFGCIFEKSVNFEHFVNGIWTHY